jgi:hypothetical protein
MSPVELLGITGEQPAHDGRDRRGSRSEKKVHMVRDKSPGVTGSGGLGEDGAETAEKVFIIPGIFEDCTLLYASHDEVMKSAGGIDTCFTGHREVSHDHDQLSLCHQRSLSVPWTLAPSSDLKTHLR